MDEKKLIDLYPYKIVDGKISFLLFKRAKGKLYEDQWRMVGGKVQEQETYWQAALRELKEETNLEPITFWTIPSINQFYEYSTDKILNIPAFAAEIKSDESIKLDAEHSDFIWIPSKEVSAYIQWPEQIRLIELTNRLITSNKILDDWLVPIPSS